MSPGAKVQPNRSTLAPGFGFKAACSSIFRDRAPTPPISQDQADALRVEIEAVGADPAKFLAFFKIKALEAMPTGRWNEAVAMLEAKRIKDAA